MVVPTRPGSQVSPHPWGTLGVVAVTQSRRGFRSRAGPIPLENEPFPVFCLCPGGPSGVPRWPRGAAQTQRLFPCAKFLPIPSLGASSRDLRLQSWDQGVKPRWGLRGMQIL